MEISANSIWADVVQIRERAPLVHNITNYVVMNTSANALLALGASPVMAHAEQEVAAMVDLAGVLVINMGTLSEHWVRAMHKAAQQAQTRNVPIVFDPVGAGATPYRTETAHQLLTQAMPAIVRGNASEINALVIAGSVTKGVDSTADPASAVEAARQLSEAHGCVVCVSGATDYIVDGDEMVKVGNGHAMMTQVTGMGCTASALCGAFAAVNPNALAATAHAMAVMGIAGEIAVQKSAGPGTLQANFLDALYSLSEADISAAQIG